MKNVCSLHKNASYVFMKNDEAFVKQIHKIRKALETSIRSSLDIKTIDQCIRIVKKKNLYIK